MGSDKPLVGRGAELARLTAAVERARTGTPAAVLLAGDAGVGKTRLLTELARRARDGGATVLVGHCVDLGAVGLPYLPFAEALRQLAEQAGADGPLAEALTDRPALDRLITRPGRPAPATGGGDDDAARLQLFDAVAGALGDAAEIKAPLLLVIEDLHWADQSTRDLLAFLLARLRSERLAVVASYRADDLHRRHPLRPLLGELVRLPAVERVELAPFTPAELSDYLRAVNDGPVPDRLVRDVLARSEGNAYFAEELLAAGLGADNALPTGLADVLLARLERLSPAVQRVARVASVAGRRVSHELLQAATGMDDTELEEALREAVTHHVLVADGGAYQFRHALHQEAVYGDLLPGEKVRLHGTYATLFADGAGSSAELAYHSMESHDLPRALSASVQAATEAMALHAPVEALRQLERALQLWDAVPDAAERAGSDLVSLQLGASQAAAGAGETGRAVALASDARDLADRLDPRGERAAAAREVLALHLLSADRPEEAYEATGEALDMVPAEPPTPVRIWAAATRARSSINLDKEPEARGWAEEALAGARTLGLTEAEADALASLALVAESAGDSAESQARLVEARDRAREAGDLSVEMRVHYNLGASHYYAGDVGTALRNIDAAVSRASATGLTFSAYGLETRVLQVIARYVIGDWDGSLEAAELAGDAAPDTVLARLAAAALYVEVGRGLPEAAERVVQLRGSWGQDDSLALVAGGCEADLLRWQGDLDGSVDAADRAIAFITRRWDKWYLGGIWLAALGLAALADRVEGERLRGADDSATVARGQGLIERARETAKRGRPRHGRIGPEGRAWLARAEAEWSRLEGPSDPAKWRAALEVFGYGYPYEEARCRWRLAEALLGADRRDEASAEVADAYGVAVRLKAAPLREALEALARRGRLEAGLPVPVRADTTLTARERDVLALLARGRTNRQIGRTLFISEKTASVHVSNILGKLGASGRTEAVAIASRRGLVPVEVQAG
ncbi:MAG TPA: AAA family ATPase [Mycobacteriales bacterium]|nr:AAA family ATPase [Mycobacteriales bacterium]